MNIAHLDKIFHLHTKDLKAIIRNFHSEMDKGLSGKRSSLKMIPTYVDVPRGDEKGNFIALDLGGTNFRILELELKGHGKYKVNKVKAVTLDKRQIIGNAKDFFGFIAKSIKDFMTGIDVKKIESMGFTFSFPIEQTSLASGRLLRWTKGFDVKEVLGNDVVKLLNEALIKNGLYGPRISALANDTVGTLVAGSYEDSHCDIGVILGTGTNACYREKLSNIAKWLWQKPPNSHMIINIEWGNFNKLRQSSYDKKLDKNSDKPGSQILEKMVSGMYLGELARLVLIDFTDTKGFLKGKSFKTEYISEIENDKSRDLRKVEALLKKLGIRDASLNERKLVKKVCELVSGRASRISAAAIASIITKIDPFLKRRHSIAVDGSLYEKHPAFADNMKATLREIFGKRASSIKMILTKDGSGKGAAIIAAIAVSERSRT